MDPVVATLAYTGIGISLWRWRKPAHLLAALAVLAGMAATILATVYGGDMRRSLIASPFIYAAAGIGAVEIIALAGRLAGPMGQRISLIAIAVGLVAALSWNVWYYFGDFTQSEHTRWVYTGDLVGSLKAAHQTADPGRIYFYSGRWSYNYEVRSFLYPNTGGVDRSREFGAYSLDRDDPGPVTYVLLPPYQVDLDRLKALYPGGSSTLEYDKQGGLRFAVYHLP